jgi:predicted RNA-binding Zn-ribbon protein involved in translation (DUF1610 family)
MKGSSTYTVSGLRCENCGWRQYDGPIKEAHPIPKGRAVADEPCPKCGVKALRARVR